MKILKLTKAVKIGLGVATISSLVACKADLDQAGINTSVDSLPNPLIFEAGSYNFITEQRILKENPGAANEVEFIYSHYDADSDRTISITSQPVTGISDGAEAEVKIVAATDLTGTIEDPNKVFEILSAICAEELLADDTVTCTDDDIDARARVAKKAELLERAADFEIGVKQKGLNLLGSDTFTYALEKSLDIETNQRVGISAPATESNGVVVKSTKVKAIFTLSDDDWSKAIRGRIAVGEYEREFNVYTEARDGIMDDPGADFLGKDKKNVRPETSYITPSVQLLGFNTQAHLKIEKDAKNSNYKLFYKIGNEDFVEFTGQDVKIRARQPLSFKVETPAGFSKAYETKVTVMDNPAKDPEGLGTFTDAFTVYTHSESYVPGPKLAVDFPPATSAATASTIGINGVVNVSVDQAEYDHPDAVIPPEGIQVTSVKVYRSADSAGENLGEMVAELTGDQLVRKASRDEVITINGTEVVLPAIAWSIPAPVSLSPGTNYFAAVAETNLSRNGVFGKTEPVVVTVMKADSFDYYPEAAVFAVLQDMRDVTVDNRTETPVLWIADSTFDSPSQPDHGIIWQYPLNGQSRPVCAALVDSWSGNPFTGIQFNHTRPETGGLFVSTHQGRTMWLDDKFLQGDVSKKVSMNDNNLPRTDYAGPQRPGHAAFAYDGLRVYVASQSKPEFRAEYQAFVSQINLKLNDDGSVNSLEVPKFSDSFSSGYLGGVANESSNPSHYNNGMSLDIYTISPDNEWLLALEGEDIGNRDTQSQSNPLNQYNVGKTYLRKIQIADDYSPLLSHTLITLKDPQGNEITLNQARAITVDDPNHMVYIADSEDDIIYRGDLSNIENSDELTLEVFAQNSPDDGQPDFDFVTSMVLEGGLKYLVAIDSGKAHKDVDKSKPHPEHWVPDTEDPTPSSILAFNLETGERTYLIKAKTQNTTSKRICEL